MGVEALFRWAVALALVSGLAKLAYAAEERASITEEPQVVKERVVVAFPEPKHPYLAQVVAELPDTAEKRKTQILAAFKMVLLRNSDLPEILDFSKVKSALKTPQKYLNSFSYVTKKNFAKNLEERFLRIQFDEHAIQNLIKDASSTVIIETRPAVFMWLFDSSVGTILTENDEKALKWQTSMAHYGITLRLPTQDDLIASSVVAADVYGRNYAKLLATNTGKAPAVLIGVIGRTAAAGEWVGSLDLLSGEVRTEINTTVAEYEAVVTQCVAKIAALLPIIRLPVSRNDIHNCQLKVLNINSYKALKDLERNLQGIKILANAELIQIRRHEAIFQLKFWSFTAELERAFRQINLVAESETTTDDTYLVYRLVT